MYLIFIKTFKRTILMKKIASLLILMVAIVSCEKDVKFNDPAFQGQKDNFLWKADATTSDTLNHYMTINAFHGSEVVSLVIPTPTAPISKANPVTYKLGSEASVTPLNIADTIKATYSYSDGGVILDYATGKDLGNGEIVITEYDLNTKKLSGTFRFNAKYLGTNTIVPENLNFQQGFIYRIPVQ